MKLWTISDWHMESRLSFDPPRPADFDVLVVAGDVSDEIPLSIQMVSAVAAGKPAVFVAGNHEWWHAGGDGWSNRAAGKRAAEDYGVTWLECAAAEIGGVRFAGATLWKEGNPRFFDSVRTLQSFGADVVVTHFPPDPVTLIGVLTEGGLWIHGHHHGFEDTKSWGRRVVRNALGAANEPAYGDPAIPDLVVEIGEDQP